MNTLINMHIYLHLVSYHTQNLIDLHNQDTAHTRKTIFFAEMQLSKKIAKPELFYRMFISQMFFCFLILYKKKKYHLLSNKTFQTVFCAKQIMTSIIKYHDRKKVRYRIHLIYLKKIDLCLGLLIAVIFSNKVQLIINLLCIAC